MTMASNPHRGFRFPAALIGHAAWLCHCFSLGLRDVETILAGRGVVVSYEGIRTWGLRFGRQFANPLKRRRPRPGDKWHLDEVFIRIRGKQGENGRRDASSQPVTRNASSPPTAGSTPTSNSAITVIEHRAAGNATSYVRVKASPPSRPS